MYCIVFILNVWLSGSPVDILNQNISSHHGMYSCEYESIQDCLSEVGGVKDELYRHYIASGRYHSVVVGCSEDLV